MMKQLTKRQLLLACNDEIDHHKIRIWFYHWLLRIIICVLFIDLACVAILSRPSIGIFLMAGTAVTYLLIALKQGTHIKFYKDYSKWWRETTAKPKLNQEDRERYHEIYAQAFVYSSVSNKL